MGMSCMAAGRGAVRSQQTTLFSLEEVFLDGKGSVVPWSEIHLWVSCWGLYPGALGGCLGVSRALHLGVLWGRTSLRESEEGALGYAEDAYMLGDFEEFWGGDLGDDGGILEVSGKSGQVWQRGHEHRQSCGFSI